MATLICSIHRGNICYSEIFKRGAERTVVLACTDKTYPSYYAEITRTLKELPVKLSHIDHSVRKYSNPEVYTIAKEIVSIIRALPSEEKEIFLHWSEGPRAGIIASILVASFLKGRVSGAYLSYGDLKKPKTVKLPLFSFRINDKKLGILSASQDGETRGYRISGKYSSLGKTRIYSVIKSLKADGFLDSEGGLTDMGKVAVLCNEVRKGK